MDFPLVSTIGAVFALITAFVVTFEYAILVNLKGNSGGRMFFALLLTIDALLSFNAARVFFGDYELRVPLLTLGLYFFGLVLAWIGVSIWRNQRAGAMDARTMRKPRTKH